MEEKSGKTKNLIKRRVVDEEVEEEGRRKLLMATADVDEVQLQSKYDDVDRDCDEEDDRDETGSDGKEKWTDVVETVVDADTDLDASDSDESDEDDSEDEDDSDDEEAALQAELAKIRAERQAAKAKAEAQAEEEEKKNMEEAALVGNPLLANDSVTGNGATGRMKRRWNDDVVFRNQAKGEPEQNKKRFINDTVRNDFHKRFLNKFIK